MRLFFVSMMIAMLIFSRAYRAACASRYADAIVTRRCYDTHAR